MTEDILIIEEAEDTKKEKEEFQTKLSIMKTFVDPGDWITVLKVSMLVVSIDDSIDTKSMSCFGFDLYGDEYLPTIRAVYRTINDEIKFIAFHFNDLDIIQR